MGNCAVCLVTDANYMFPTVVAAAQARAAIRTPGTEVFIFAMGLSPEKAKRYQDVCDEHGVRLQLVSREVYGDSDDNAFVDAFFAQSKFTFGALGRFFLDQVTPAGFDQLLYLDGDIQIHGPLDDLVQTPVPDGRFLAAADPKIFWINMDTPAAQRERGYMQGLGKNSPEAFETYFNSGILRIARKGWREIGEKAFEYLRGNPDRCVCHDQSALNATSAEARLRLSIKWNFAPYLRYYGLEPVIAPSIIHFMSHPKPWNGAFPPWSAAEHRVYLDFLARRPELRPDFARFGPKLTARYHLQQRVKRLDEMMHPGRRRTVVANVMRYEEAAARQTA